jgi:hypothetical protein
MDAGMGGLVWVGFLAFFVVSLTVGVRLLLLWRRTRALPELLIGTGVLGIGPVGFGFAMGGSLLAPRAPGLAALLLGTASLAASLGVVAKCTFNWRVYHPEDAWAGAVAYAAAAVLGVCFGVKLWQGFETAFLPDPAYFVRAFVQIGALLWGAGEALRYHALMRRRVRLGIADPVVANRFLLWGVGAGAAGVGSLVGTVAQLATGATVSEAGWVTASSSLHGLVAAVALWLAFLPPEAWRRFVLARAAAA